MRFEYNVVTFVASLQERWAREPQWPTALLLLNPKRLAFMNQQCGVATTKRVLADVEKCMLYIAPDAPATRAGAGRYALILADEHALRREEISLRLRDEVAAVLRPHETQAMRDFASEVALVTSRRTEQYDDTRPVLGVAVVTVLCRPEMKLSAKDVFEAAQCRADAADNEVVPL
ncbi:MAG: hypothetical protein V4540_03485 [Pseudomonadota bacterium]